MSVDSNNNFIVSARKYRPSTFESVVGQKHITSTLQNAISNNQLAQAFLFCGPRGVGKTTCARILAKTINCTNITPDVEACNECESCKSFNDGSSFNIFELDAASNNSVDDIRELVEQVNVPPTSGKYKVYIIDEVHMLSQAAFNAFLKTLEEPPAYAKFILATTEKHKILPTILSRCQIFDFHRITNSDISDHLEYIAKSENIKYEKSALDIIASKSDGALRDALSTFDTMVSFTNGNLMYKDILSSLNILDYDYFFRFVDFLLAGDISNTLLLFDEVLKKGFEGDTFINGLSAHLRNLLVCKDSATVCLLDVSASAQERYLQQSQRCHQLFILRCMDFANKSAQEYRTATGKRLCVELMLLKMCNVMNKLMGAEKKNSSSEVIPTPASTPTPSQTPITQASKPLQEENKVATPATPNPANTISDAQASTEKRAFNPNNIRRSAFSINYNTNMPAPRPADEVIEEPFDLNKVKKALEILASSLKNEEHANLYYAIQNTKLESSREYVVQMWCKSALDENELNKYKSQILIFLKNKLSYTRLKLEVMYKAQERAQLVYNPVDKYFRIAEKNPIVQDLKEYFGADLSY